MAIKITKCLPITDRNGTTLYAGDEILLFNDPDVGNSSYILGHFEERGLNEKPVFVNPSIDLVWDSWSNIPDHFLDSIILSRRRMVANG